MSNHFHSFLVVKYFPSHIRYELLHGYDMIFIYCNWFSTPWQLSVNMYSKNRKYTATCKRKNNKKYKRKEYTK